jgi:hypothetical protein
MLLKDSFTIFQSDSKTLETKHGSPRCQVEIVVQRRQLGKIAVQFRLEPAHSNRPWAVMYDRSSVQWLGTVITAVAAAAAAAKPGVVGASGRAARDAADGCWALGQRRARRARTKYKDICGEPQGSLEEWLTNMTDI